jgi:hypothetical protein
LREPDVLTPAEFQAPLKELRLREKAEVLLAGSIGLRRSELFALELLRHASSRITMDLYTQAVAADKRDASLRQMEMLLAQPAGAA